MTLHLTGANVSFYDCPGIEVYAVMESLIDWTPQVISVAGAGRPKMVRNIFDTLVPAVADVGLLLSTKPTNTDGTWKVATAQGGGSFLEEDTRGHAKFGRCPDTWSKLS